MIKTIAAASSRTSVENKAQIRNLINLPDALKSLPEVRDGKLGDIPTLGDLGVEDKTGNADSRTAFPFLGGESAAIDRLNDYFWKSDNVAKYKETRNGLIGAVRPLTLCSVESVSNRSGRLSIGPPLKPVRTHF